MPPSPQPPSLRFCYAEALHAKVLHLLETLEQVPDPSKYRGALGDLVVELTDAGIDDYFLQPLRVAKAGFLVQQTANLGVASKKPRRKRRGFKGYSNRFNCESPAFSVR